MSISQEYMQWEHQFLSPYASFADSTRGREIPIEECPVRTPYQRDRDRIIHCNAYRRLMHKTQVFLSPEGDHYRTRLTHTMEVSQIARTIARAMRLNEDLTEAIALGHDLGHTPFGHAGERVLNKLNPGGFAHSEQSVRVVEKLEKDGKGLNLCWEVRDGIRCHSSGSMEDRAATLEGRIVRYSDKIAYMNHDLDDAVRAGLLSEGDLPWEVHYHLGRSKSERISTFINDIVANSRDDIYMSSDVQRCFDIFMEFMFDQVYTNPIAKGEEVKACDMISKLFDYFVHTPDKLPREYWSIAQQEGIERAVCDYISGMSDRYCVTVFQDLFIPKSWGVI